MSDLKNLNSAAEQARKRLQDPDWRVGKKKDLEDFSRGATQSGSGEIGKAVSGGVNRVKKAWKALTE